MDSMRVLFHVNEADRWDAALGNISNLIKDVGVDSVEIVVVANGPSVVAFIDGDKLAVMKEQAGQGVKILACRNALKKMCYGVDSCISEASLPSFIAVVPAGITEIIRRQAEGYSYVKP